MDAVSLARARDSKVVSEEISTDYHYFNWVDQFDTLGLGATCR